MNSKREAATKKEKKDRIKKKSKHDLKKKGKAVREQETADGFVEEGEGEGDDDNVIFNDADELWTEPDRFQQDDDDSDADDFDSDKVTLKRKGVTKEMFKKA